MLLSNPATLMLSAVVSMALRIWTGVAVGSAWSIRAATAAAWGAAAEVPLKFGRPSLSMSRPGTKNVVFTASGATISGLKVRASGVASRWPAVSKSTAVGPALEYVSRTAGFAPNAGVFR